MIATIKNKNIILRCLTIVWSRHNVEYFTIYIFWEQITPPNEPGVKSCTLYMKLSKSNNPHKLQSMLLVHFGSYVWIASPYIIRPLDNVYYSRM